jgi:hypothetical protein
MQRASNIRRKGLRACVRVHCRDPESPLAADACTELYTVMGDGIGVGRTGEGPFEGAMLGPFEYGASEGLKVGELDGVGVRLGTSADVGVDESTNKEGMVVLDTGIGVKVGVTLVGTGKDASGTADDSVTTT